MLKNILIFGAGIITGGFAVYQFIGKKMEAQYEAEIEEAKGYYIEKLNKISSAAEKTLNEAEKASKTPDIEEDDSYNRDKIIERLNYGAMFKPENSETAKEEELVMQRGTTGSAHGPEIISDDEYYSNDEYEKETITYYSENKKFITPLGEPITFEEMMENIGKESYLEEFGGYENDALFVRNYDKMTDYEIILEESEYDGE